MRYPKFLSEHGKIGVPAPSFGAVGEPYKTAFLNAQCKFEALGHKLAVGPNVFKSDGLGISTVPSDCTRELLQMYCWDETDVLISCGGGELMCETIEHLDFDAIAKAEPKWFMGYSDNTNFTFLLNILCDTASVYGPSAPAFGMEPWHESLDDAYRILRGEQNTVSGYPLWQTVSKKDEENPLEPYNTTEQSCSRVLCGDNEPAFSGRLIGGCVDILCNILGTRFDKVDEYLEKYRDDGFVWFLECCDLNVYDMRRAMWRMKNAGWFKYARGFLIGRPAKFGQTLGGVDQYNAITGILGELGLPIIADLDIGHLPPMMPLVCGSVVDVEYKNDRIKLKMNYR